MEWESPVKKKKRRKQSIERPSECVIHVAAGDKDKALSAFTSQSWETALKASSVRQDNLLSRFTEIPDPTKYGKHRTCYAIYTNLKNYRKARQIQVPRKRSSRGSSSSSVPSTLANKECAICRKNKTEKGGSGYEKLQQCITELSANALKSYAHESKDEYLTVQLAGLEESDIIAKEFMYHRSCYRNVTRASSDSVERNSETKLRDQCYEELKSFIEERVLREGEFLRMSYVANYYGDIQDHAKIERKGCLVQNIKTRLTKDFGDQIGFFKKNVGSCEVVYATEEVRLDVDNSLRKIKETGRVIREELLNTKDLYVSWPPTEKELLSKKFKVPEHTEALLVSILSGKGKPSEKTKRIVNSIAQDLLYNASHGRKKSNKHAELGVAVKRKTGSVTVIRWLNRYGHTISYDEINALETKLAEDQTRLDSFSNYVPNNIQPSTFVTFVYDNCDHNAESIYNTTLHATNGIIIQRSTLDIEASVEMPVVSNKQVKRRSFKPIQYELPSFVKEKERPNPEPIKNVDNNLNEIDGWFSRCEDLIWHLLRYVCSNDGQLIPGWKGFFHQVAEKPDDTHVVGYLPTIPKSPTSMDTVQEVLRLCKVKAESLNLKETDLVLDHAIYSKAVEIIMMPRNADLKNFINLRMGGFHAVCIFMGVIGKRFSEAGLKDLIVESGLIGEESTQQVLNGKHYNKAIRIHLYVAEAIMRMKLDAFKDWLIETNNFETYTTIINSKAFKDLHTIQNPVHFKNCIENLEELFTLYDQFEMVLSDQNEYPMAVFWNSYLNMVQILRDFSKSIKSGDWDLHMYAAEKMLHWFHAYDHYNYARHFSYYWASQQALGETHPEMLQEFKDGNFSIRRCSGRFNKISPDQVIEQTINKDQKGPGGIIGFSTTEGTVQRWELTSHIVAKLRSDMEESIGINKTSPKPKELQPSRIKFDENSVKKCYNKLKEWSTMFQKCGSLVSLSSGVNATQEVQDDLMRAEELGKVQAEKFIEDRIKQSNVKFYDTIKKNKLKTFTSMKASKTVSVKGKDLVIRADRNLFARLLVIREKREISLKELLRFSLGPIAWSLATPTGTIYKSVKSKLLTSLESKISLIDAIPPRSARIYDGMCIIQQLPTGLETFGDVSDYVLKRITSNDAEKIFFVTDQYWDQSIKNCERSRRAATGSIKVTASRSDQKLPKQIKKYLSLGSNKEELVDFLLADWKDDRHCQYIRNRSIYFTTKEYGFELRVINNKVSCLQKEELCSNQEEADTKVFLAAKVAEEMGCTNIAIFTVDSDVAILACFYARKLQNRLIVHIGSGNNVRILDVGDNEWSNVLLDSLPSLHALSGCDAVSAFNGIGKKKWLAKVENCDEFLDAIQNIGENINVDGVLLKAIEGLICSLYGFPEETEVNEVRYKKFCSNKTPEPNLLPPTKDELLQHVERANYQAFIWKRAMEANPDIPSPVGHGWIERDDGSLEVKWMEQQPAPQSILEFIVCDCKRAKCAAQCQCRGLMMECTDLCKCNASCENIFYGDSEGSDEENDEEIDGEENEIYYDEVFED